MAHQLETLVLRMDDVGPLAFNILLQLSNCHVVSVFISFVDNLVSAFHCAQFSDPQVLLKALEPL